MLLTAGRDDSLVQNGPDNQESPICGHGCARPFIRETSQCLPYSSCSLNTEWTPAWWNTYRLAHISVGKDRAAWSLTSWHIAVIFLKPQVCTLLSMAKKNTRKASSPHFVYRGEFCYGSDRPTHLRLWCKGLCWEPCTAVCLTSQQVQLPILLAHITPVPLTLDDWWDGKKWPKLQYWAGC